MYLLRIDLERFSRTKLILIAIVWCGFLNLIKGSYYVTKLFCKHYPVY